MAENRLQYIFDLIKGKNTITPELKNVDKQAKKTTGNLKNGFGNVFKSIQGLSSSIFNLRTGFALLSSAFVFKRAIDAANQQEDAINKLNVALKATGKFTKETSLELQNFASSLQGASKFGDELILENAGLIQSLGNLEVSGLKRATQAALDLSSALGISLTSAATLVGKAAAGEIGSFSRYGVIIQKGADNAETFANALDALNSKFGGAAAGQLATFSGATAQLSNTFGDLIEEFGFFITQNEAVIEIIKQVQNAFAALITIVRELRDNKGLTEFITNFIKIGAIVGAATSAILGLSAAFVTLKAVVIAAGGAFALLKIAIISTGIGALVVGLGIAIATFAKDWDENVQKVKEAWETFGNFIRRVPVIGTIFEVNEAIVKLAINWETTLIKMSAYWEAFITLLANTKDNVFNGFILGIDLLQARFFFIIDVVRERWESFLSFLSDSGELIKQVFKSALDLDTESIGSAFDEFTKKTNENLDITSGKVEKLEGEFNDLNDVLKQSTGIKTLDFKVDLTEYNKALADANKEVESIEKKAEETQKKTRKPASKPAEQKNQQKEDKKFLQELTKARANPFKFIFGKDKIDLAKGLGIGSGIATAIANGANGAGKILATGAARAIDAFAPGFGAAAEPLLNAFLAGPDAVRDQVKAFAKALPELTVALVEGAVAFVEEIINQIPSIITGFIRALPRIIRALTIGLINAFVGLVEAVPEIIDALVREAPRLIEKLAENIGPIINALAEKAPDIIAALVRSAPRIITALVAQSPRISLAIIQGLIPGFSKLGGILDISGQGFSGKVSEAGEKFFNFVSNAGEQVFNIIKKAGEFIFNIFKDIGKLYIETFKKLLDNVIKVFTEGPKKFIEELIGGAGDFVSALIDAITGGGGSNPITGTADNILDVIPGLQDISTDGVTGSIEDAINDAISDVGDFFGFAKGGQVPAGFPNDSFRARLSSGENVIDRTLNQKLERYLNNQDGQNSQVTNALLSQLLEMMRRPMVVNTTAQVNERAFADIMIELNRNNVRTVF